MIWVKIGALTMVAGVMLGAFGVHALKTKMSEYAFDVYKTGVLYHLVHGLGLFVIAWLRTYTLNPKVDLAGIFLFAGIILFSGSLYILALTDQKWLGAVTPLGGLSFLAGWLILLFTAVKH